jgi:pilus assembly protein CpaB
VVKKAVPKLAVAENGVTDLSSLNSKVSAVALMPGEQLLASRMVEQNAFLGPARVQVPNGLQELTLKLPIERVAGGVLKAGDTVGVFISIEDSGAQGGKASRTQLTFHKVLVTGAQFSNGTATQTGGSDSSTGATQASSTSSSKEQTDDTYLVTLARNSADAERIVFAAEFGKIYLSKEPGDALETSSGVVDKAGLFR